MIDIPKLLERLGIEAKQKGDHWWARCPYHADKKPSWRIRDQAEHPNHGANHCFSCGGGGSAVWLVMELLDMPARAAALWIHSGKLPEKPVNLAVEIVGKQAELERVFRLPSGSVVAPLHRWPPVAQAYAAKRFLNAEQVARWGLGFAVEGRLRGRIVIPVRDSFGTLKSYTARAWGNANRRYLEPRTEEGADKGAVFGEEHWPEERRELVLSEGALNALALERAGAPVVGALEGSQLTAGHVARVSTFETVIVASDPDKAGDKLRAALSSLGRWVKLRQMRFPTGFDACDVERERGRGTLELMIREARLSVNSSRNR